MTINELEQLKKGTSKPQKKFSEGFTEKMTELDAIQILSSYGVPQDEEEFREALDMAIKALSVEPQEWIPIKTRPLTKEEKEHYAEMGYSDDSVTFMYDCPLPDDGEEVLVTDWLGNVESDTFIRDECDGCYFEENCDDGEVVAWMHKPSPYKGDTE